MLVIFDHYRLRHHRFRSTSILLLLNHQSPSSSVIIISINIIFDHHHLHHLIILSIIDQHHLHHLISIINSIWSHCLMQIIGNRMKHQVIMRMLIVHKRCSTKCATKAKRKKHDWAYSRLVCSINYSHRLNKLTRTKDQKATFETKRKREKTKDETNQEQIKTQQHIIISKGSNVQILFDYQLQKRETEDSADDVVVLGQCNTSFLNKRTF